MRLGYSRGFGCEIYRVLSFQMRRTTYSAPISTPTVSFASLCKIGTILSIIRCKRVIRQANQEGRYQGGGSHQQSVQSHSGIVLGPKLGPVQFPFALTASE